MAKVTRRLGASEVQTNNNNDNNNDNNDNSNNYDSNNNNKNKVQSLWPSQVVRDFREERKGDVGFTRQTSSLIKEKSRSLRDVSKMTVQMEDVEKGLSDIAALRSDGSGSYYSNFTRQGTEPPVCLARYPRLLGFWSYCAFMLSGMRQLMFNAESLLMSLAGGLSTWLCSQEVLDLRATYQTSAIFIGLIFPLVFLIGQTWARREKATERLATIKANAVELVLKMVVGRREGATAAVKVIDEISAVIEEIGKYLPQDSQHSGLRLTSIYSHFAALQEVPECAMLTRSMLCEFEKLRAQRDYRTPWKLNYFVFIFGSLSPVLCAPLFASMGCLDRNPARVAAPGETCGYGTVGAYCSSFFFALVVSSLLSVVQALEDPFNLGGSDDVIASFTFEANALLQLIEERRPGSLTSGGSATTSTTTTTATTTAGLQLASKADEDESRWQASLGLSMMQNAALYAGDEDGGMDGDGLLGC